MSEASDYELNENMIALYDFYTNPIKGKYHSVIFDKRAGIILCQKNSRQLINHLLKHKLILGAVLQKKLQKELGFYYRHTISLGEIAYFSLRAHSEKQYFLDWLASYADGTTRKWSRYFFLSREWL